MRNPLKTYLQDLISTQLDEKRIVLWYDEKGFFKNYIGDDFVDSDIIHFNESYFELRDLLKDKVENPEESKILIYLITKRDKKNLPLNEIESIGFIFEGEGSKEKNLSPTVVIREALSGGYPKEIIEELVIKVENQTYDLKEIESIIGKVKPQTSTAIPLIFNTEDPHKIIFSFLSSTEFDKKIEEKEILEELTNLVLVVFPGIKLGPVKNISALREKLFEYILISEVVQVIDVGEIKKFEKVNYTSESNELKSISSVLDEIRSKTGLENIYDEMASKIQKKYKLEKLKTDLARIQNCFTFRFIEDQIIGFYVEHFPDKRLDWNTVNKGRQNSIWKRIDPGLNLVYDLLNDTYELNESITETQKEIETTKQDLSQLIKNYADKWSLVDNSYRKIEQKYYDFETSPVYDERFEKIINNLRKKYFELLNQESKILKNNILDIRKVKVSSQKEIYSNFVKPLLSNESNKVAYILVDALRFEMSQDLIEILPRTSEVEVITAVSSIPTITKVGMLNLLLEKEKAILMESGRGGIDLKVEGQTLNQRKDRISYFSKSEKEVFVTKIEDLIKPKKTTRDKISSSNFILVTSQEIDQLGEMGNDILLKQFAPDLIKNLARACVNLIKNGVTEIIISSDHGFLLSPEIGKDLKIDVPTGDRAELHERVWIGKGGNDHPSTFRIKAKEFGYDSELDFVFPVGSAVFNTPGQDKYYLHSGVSFQELVIPIIRIKSNEQQKITSPSQEDFSIKLPKDQISNRIFMVDILFSSSKLEFVGEEEQKSKVKLIIHSKDKEIGNVVAAKSGFNESNRSLELKNNEVNTVTIMLSDVEGVSKFDLNLYEYESDVLLTSKKDIPLKITI